MQTKKIDLVLFALGCILLFSACHPDRPFRQSGSWDTGIGTGEPGVANGPAGKAEFTAPFGITTDAEDNVYVTEQPTGGLGVVRKITPDGTVSTFAGNQKFESFTFFRDGPCSSAVFFGTFGVTTDNQGNVFVGDATNNRVRKISGGQVSTLANNDNMAPYGIAMDAQKKIYATDLISSRIFTITQDGAIKVFAGGGIGGFLDGAVSVARFNNPFGLAVDNQGNVFVADEGNERIRKIAPDGFVTTVAGTGVAGLVDGKAEVAQFNAPSGVAVDAAGNLYVADKGNNRIRKITPTGTVSTLAGTGNPDILNGPMGLAVDKHGTYLYVTDNGNYKIRRIKL